MRPPSCYFNTIYLGNRVKPFYGVFFLSFSPLSIPDSEPRQDYSIFGGNIIVGLNHKTLARKSRITSHIRSQIKFKEHCNIRLRRV